MDDAVAAYRVFATDRTRPVEMDASQGPELQAWLSARLGRPMALPDPPTYGFALRGGRWLATPHGAAASSEARRRGTGCVRPCRSRWSPVPSKTEKTKKAQH